MFPYFFRSSPRRIWQLVHFTIPEIAIPQIRSANDKKDYITLAFSIKHFQGQHKRRLLKGLCSSLIFMPSSVFFTENEQ